MNAPELELKFEVPDKALPGLEEYLAFAQPEETRRLRSTYFDTPSRDLRNASLGLRIRRGDGETLQTLKYEKHAGPLIRHEWETTVGSDRPDPTALADTPASDILDKSADALEPVFTTNVERTSRIWTRADDMVEVSLDRGEITSGSDRESIQELELELKSGEPQALFELATMLVERLKLPLMFQSKAERGYRLADDPDWRPERARSITIAPDMPAAEAFRELAHISVAQIANNARTVSCYRANEALHQLRVGLRRFRAALSTFRPFIEDSDYALIREETKWLASEMDAARDVDVFIEESFRTVTAEPTDRPAFAQFGKQLLRAQSKAYDRALAALASPRFATLLLSTIRWVETGPWTASDEPVIRSLRECSTHKFAANQLDRMRRKLRRRGRLLAHLDDQQRHRLRIKAKKLRYSAEFFSETFGHAKRQRRFLNALAEFQDSLGQLHDTSVASQLALKIVQGRPIEAAYAAGVTIEHKRNSARKIERKALVDFDAFKNARRFWT